MTGVWDTSCGEDAWDDDGGYIPMPEPEERFEKPEPACHCGQPGCDRCDPEECPPGVHSMFDFCPGREVCQEGYGDDDTDDDTDPCP